jgi:hypothetical protein
MRAMIARLKVPLLTLAVATVTPSAAIPQQGATRAGIIDLTIGGGNESRPNYSFTSIAHVVTDPSGRIFVSDAEEHVVRVYSPAGVHLFNIGRRGQGPGEFEGPTYMAFDTRGRLWVRDGGNMRYNGYTVAATRAQPVATIRMSHAEGDLWAPLTFDEQGRLVDIGQVAAKGGGTLRVRFHLDSTGRVMRADTVGKPPGDSVPEFAFKRKVPGMPGVESAAATYYFTQPFGGLWVSAHGPGGEWMSGSTGAYAFAWMGPRGKLRVIARTVPPVPLIAADRTSAEERFAAFMKRSQATRREIPFGVPTTKAPVRAIALDIEGRLWVERSVQTGTARVADVFGRDGALAGTVIWPASVAIIPGGTARGWTAVGIMSDTSDVESVVRIVFR